MESEKIEEKPPSEEIKPQTSIEVASTSEPKKETIELTQEIKDKCNILFLIFIKLL